MFATSARTPRRCLSLASLAPVALAGLLGCSDEGAAEAVTRVTPPEGNEPHRVLSAWNLFSDAPSQTPSYRVVPFQVNAPLFTDYASKRRFLYVPEGQQIEYSATAPWRFPPGSVLIKTFSYANLAGDAERLLETRLLVFGDSGVEAHTYVWNEEQEEAALEIAGATLAIDGIDADGSRVDIRYSVPNTNQCAECHGEGSKMNTLGARTRQLNGPAPSGGANQIDDLVRLDLLSEATEAANKRSKLVDPFGAAKLEDRVRAYMDANCGHCHTEGASAESSALFLEFSYTAPETRDTADVGVCKVPRSAGGATCGLTFDIVPGAPNQSLMLCRVESEEAKVMMPPLGRSLQHAAGANLIRQWIKSMAPNDCK